MAKTKQPNALELVLQLDTYQRNITPLLGPVGQKLVSDLLDTGVRDRTIAKAIGRSPSYVRAAASGAKRLSASNIAAIVNSVVRGGESNAE